VCSQRKIPEAAAPMAEETELIQPTWVIDHETFNLWELGVDEAALPEDVKLTAETKAQLSRLREWAKGEMERRRAEPVLEVQAEPEPSQPALVTPSVSSQSMWGWGPGSVVCPRATVFDPAIKAKAVALATGPRVGPSPTSVMQHE
jgi:hypothetical protein